MSNYMDYNIILEKNQGCFFKILGVSKINKIKQRVLYVKRPRAAIF
jgi:hypothetical protein